LAGPNLSGAKLGGAANLSGAIGPTCGQIRAAQTDETTNLPTALKFTK